VLQDFTDTLPTVLLNLPPLRRLRGDGHHFRITPQSLELIERAKRWME